MRKNRWRKVFKKIWRKNVVPRSGASCHDLVEKMKTFVFTRMDASLLVTTQHVIASHNRLLAPIT